MTKTNSSDGFKRIFLCCRFEDDRVGTRPLSLYKTYDYSLFNLMFRKKYQQYQDDVMNDFKTRKIQRYRRVELFLVAFHRGHRSPHPLS